MWWKGSGPIVLPPSLACLHSLILLNATMPKYLYYGYRVSANNAVS